MFWSWFIISYCVTPLSESAEMFRAMLVPGLYDPWLSCVACVASTTRLCATNSLNSKSKAYCISQIIYWISKCSFLRILWEQREKREGIYIHAYVTHPHRRIPANLRQIVSINKVETNFAIVPPEAVKPTMPKRWELVSTLHRQTTQLVIQKLETLSWAVK